MSDDLGTATAIGEYPQTISLPNGNFVVFGVEQKSACSLILDGKSYDWLFSQKTEFVKNGGSIPGCANDVFYSASSFSDGKFLHAFWGKNGSSIGRRIVQSDLTKNRVSGLG